VTLFDCLAGYLADPFFSSAALLVKGGLQPIVRKFVFIIFLQLFGANFLPARVSGPVS